MEDKKTLTPNDLELGRIYWGQHRDGTPFIFKKLNDRKEGFEVTYMYGKNFCKNGSMGKNGLYTFKEATEQEKAHLNACIEAGKYVEAPKFKKELFLI